jgi:hypothetical protein
MMVVVHMGEVSTLQDLLNEAAHTSLQCLTIMVEWSTWEKSSPSIVSLWRWPNPSPDSFTMLKVGSTWEDHPPGSPQRGCPPLPNSPFLDVGWFHMGGVCTLHNLLKELFHSFPQLLTMMVVVSTWEESPSSSISSRRQPSLPTAPYNDGGWVHVVGVSALHNFLKEGGGPSLPACPYHDGG